MRNKKINEDARISKDEVFLNEISSALKENMRKLDELLKEFNYPMPNVIDEDEDENI